MESQMKGFYTTQGHAHALNIYNFPQDVAQRPMWRVHSLRFFYQNREKTIPPTTEELTQTCRQVFDELFDRRGDDKYLQALYELVDLIHNHVPGLGDVMLERLREIEEKREVTENNLPEVDRKLYREVKEREVKERKEKPTVYTDSQNVHNSKINQSVLKVAGNLYSMYKNVINLQNLDDQKNYDYKIRSIREIFRHLKTVSTEYHLLDITENYLRENLSMFSTPQGNISLVDVFLSVWLWICDHNNKSELTTRLVEEMKEMKGYCTTGHLARFISTIQGFTTDEKLEIRISSLEQCTAVVKQYLTKVLQDCEDDEVLTGMVSGSEKYITFIRHAISLKIVQWKTEYGEDMLDEVANIVNKFCGVGVYKN